MPAPHSLAHALDPAGTRCAHNMRDITACVVCRAALDPNRRYTEVCGRRCMLHLLDLQRKYRSLTPPGEPGRKAD